MRRVLNVFRFIHYIRQDILLFLVRFSLFYSENKSVIQNFRYLFKLFFEMDDFFILFYEKYPVGTCRIFIKIQFSGSFNGI